MIEDYLVYIGEDKFQVKAKDNREAAYRAAGLFKEKYSLTCSLSDIVYYARTHLAPIHTTRGILTILRKE